MQFRGWKVIERSDNHTPQPKVLTPSVIARDYRAEDTSKGAPIKFTSSEINDAQIWLNYPDVSFQTCYNHYKTSGKLFNTTEAYVSEIKTRKHSYKGQDSDIKKMEEWEKTVGITNIKEIYTRDMLVTGNYIYGFADWQPVPIANVIGLVRDDFGNVKEYWYRGAKNQLKKMGTPKEFGHEKYIAIGRDAWGYGMAFALMSTYVDTDGNTSTSALDGDKQIFQDFLKIYHKYASPRSIWSFPNATNPDDFNAENPNSLAARIRLMKPGDRLATPMEVAIVSEEINAQARFTDGIDKIVDPEVGAGLQSTANRMISEPSAMADAKEASKKVDDPKSAAIMQDFLEWMNNVVIPKIVGENTDLEFTWGSQDDFEFDPQLALSLFQAGVVSVSEIRLMIGETGMPLDDKLFEQDKADAMQQQQDMAVALDDEEGAMVKDQKANPKPEDPKDTKERLEIEQLKKHAEALDKIGKFIDNEDHSY